MLMFSECKGTTVHLLKQGSKPVAKQYKRQRIEIVQTPEQFDEEQADLRMARAKADVQAQVQAIAQQQP